MEIEYYESQLEGCSNKQELKLVIDEAFQDDSLSQDDIQNLKEYAQEISDEFNIKDFEREEAERHGEDYLTDDELGLTQM